MEKCTSGREGASESVRNNREKFYRVKIIFAIVRLIYFINVGNCTEELRKFCIFMQVGNFVKS
jgi:hypothetical protein